MHDLNKKMVIHFLTVYPQALVFFFLNYERMKGVRSSGYLTIFWLLYVVLWILPFKQNVEVLLETEVSIHYCWIFKY